MSVDGAYKAVVAYKAIKSTLEGTAALILVTLDYFGETARLHELALGLRGQMVHRSSIALVELLTRATTPRVVLFTVVALAIDSVISGLEGWSLHRRYRWAPWVVIVTTGLLLPPELIELVRQPRLGRALLLLVNLAVVVVLIRRTQRGQDG